LIPAAIQAVPAIVNSISGGRSINAADVVTDEEVGERFFGSFIPQLASGLFHHLPGIIEVLRRRGSRDLPVATAPVATVPGLPGAPQDEQQRFFGGLLQAILPVVVNAVPSVLQAIQGQRRNLGLPDETDATVVERDFSTVLSGLLGKVINVLPQVAETLFSQRDVDPQNGEEVQQRFIFPLLATLIPAAAQAIPAIISAVSGQRDVDESVIDVADKEIAQRFFGPLIGQLASGIVQQLPQIMQVFSPRPREHQLNWINFTGQWLPDHDVVRTVERDLGDPGSVEFQLEQPYGTWWKGLAVWIGGTKVQEVGVQDSRNTSDPIRIPVGDVAGAGWIQLLKAKTFGVHTPMYALTGLDQKAGKHVTFRWEHS
jgi:hypothetical protein